MRMDSTAIRVSGTWIRWRRYHAGGKRMRPAIPLGSPDQALLIQAFGSNRSAGANAALRRTAIFATLRATVHTSDLIPEPARRSFPRAKRPLLSVAAASVALLGAGVA